jgi:argininosuccinate lyase
MWKGRFAQETAAAVNAFTQSLDLDWRLASSDIEGSRAHVAMLAEVGLLETDEARQIDEALLQIDQEVRSGDFRPSEDLEDVHMNIEARLIEKLGSLGAKLHMGRSRNDQVATTMRLFLRGEYRRLASGLKALLEVLLARAEADREILIPGYTHLQQAQPISLGHYWMGHFECFRRDARRLAAAFEAIDESPLGAGALAGSTLPLDREMTSRLLRFARPTRNSLDTVAQRDYLLDYHHFASVFALHCSRLAEDLILYASQEFGWLVLPDAYCTGSSMMPQKKNPDVLELVRGRTGQVVGHLVDLIVSLKGLPSTYNRDLQEDKRGLWASLSAVEAVLSVLPDLLAHVSVDERRAQAAFEGGFLLATDVAEHLVERGVPFREAHEKTGKAVRWCLDEGRALDSLALVEWRRLLPEVGEDLLARLNAREAVRLRRTYGGTSFERVAEAVAEGRSFLRDSWPLEG